MHERLQTLVSPGTNRQSIQEGLAVNQQRDTCARGRPRPSPAIASNLFWFRGVGAINRDIYLANGHAGRERPAGWSLTGNGCRIDRSLRSRCLGASIPMLRIGAPRLNLLPTQNQILTTRKRKQKRPSQGGPFLVFGSGGVICTVPTAHARVRLK
jgi:hypothetical protein